MLRTALWFGRAGVAKREWLPILPLESPAAPACTKSLLFSTLGASSRCIPDSEVRHAFDNILWGSQKQVPCVLAVSGGPDSMALLRLFHHYLSNLAQSALFGRSPARIACVVTVNHMLRAEAQEEAEGVASVCESFGIKHLIRRIDWAAHGHPNRPDCSDLQLAARSLRYSILAQVCKEEGASHLLLGHTADDQMETFLMRWGRASGIDGLKGMSSVSRRSIRLPRSLTGGAAVDDDCSQTVDAEQQLLLQDVTICRPLLGFRKERLINACRDFGASFFTDKSNKDDTYDRVRARELLGSVPSSSGGDVVNDDHLTFEDLRDLHSAVASTAEELTRRADQLIHSVGIHVDEERGEVSIPVELWALSLSSIPSSSRDVVTNAALSRLLALVALKGAVRSQSEQHHHQHTTIVPQQKHLTWLSKYLSKLRQAELRHDEQRRQAAEGTESTEKKEKQMAGDAPTRSGKWPVNYLLEGKVEVTVKRIRSKGSDSGASKVETAEPIRYILELKPAASGH
jgi:tRNA(Ile)-lysidine synthetase-like protein